MNNPNMEKEVGDEGLVAYNNREGLVQIKKIQCGTYNKKQIITRNALCRHFDVKVSSSKSRDYASEDELGIGSKNRCSTSGNHTKKYINTLDKYGIILSPLKEDIKVKDKKGKCSRAPHIVNKSTGECSNPNSIVSAPLLRSSFRKENEYYRNDSSKCSKFRSSGDEKINCKYKVVFNNRNSSSEACSRTISDNKHDIMMFGIESVQRETME